MVLKNLEDYWNWEKLIEHSQKIEELTPFEKEKVRRAFQILKGEFGEDFLKNAFEEHHPFFDYIRNTAPWTRKWIAWFGEALEELKIHENYLALLNRLKNKDRFREGLQILRIGYKLSKGGFKIAVDPAVKVSEKEKIPDLKIVEPNKKEELFIEACIMMPSEIEERAFETMRKITDILWRSVPFLWYCGRLYKTLSRMHLAEIANKVKETLEKVKKDNAFHELIIEDVIELAIAPEKDKEILQKWASERKLNVGEFHGPRIDVNEILRVKREIEKEQRQLPKDYPNMVIIENTNLFFRTHDIRKAISELEEEIYEYPHLLFGIIEGHHLGIGQNLSILKDQHAYIEKTRMELLVEKYIILFNRFCEFKISPAVITKIYNAFQRY